MSYALIAVSVAAVAALWVAAAAWGRSRAARRRIASLVARLDEADLAEIERSSNLEQAVSRLQRAVEDRVRDEHEKEIVRRRTTEALQRVDEGVVVADEAGRLVFANPTARRYIGGRRVDALVDNRIRALIRTAIDDQHEATDVLELLGPPRRTLAFRVYPVDDGAKSIGAVLFLGDRSESRQVDAVRRDFVSNISHELKTPVGALGVLAETLAGTLDEPAVAGRLADRLVAESDRLIRIIDDLVALARLDAEDEPKREVLCVDFLAADAVERVRAGSVDVASTFDLEIPSELEVIGDRRQLTSALYNLIENAVKYSAPGDPVRISAKQIAPDRCQISVVDRGCGIPTGDQQRIFERFYRVDRARSRATGGTGLGLAIVRHVVANHGGTIDLASEEGVGSAFTVTLRTPARDLESGPGEQAEFDLDLADLDTAARTDLEDLEA